MCGAEQLNQIVINVSVAARFAQTDVFLRSAISFVFVTGSMMY